MKKITMTAFLIAVFALTGFAQDTLQNKENNKPKVIYQVGAAKVVVWKNTSAHGTWKNFEVKKIYKKGGEWKSTNYFDEKELLELKAAIDKAINEESVKTKNPTEQK